MSIRQLKTLIAFHETGSFSAAADRVFITHAAVSQQMRALEEQLGVQIFDRNMKPPVLTPTGHDIVKKAIEVCNEYDHLFALNTLNKPLQGDIHLGSVRTPITKLIPATLALLRDHYSSLEVHLISGVTGELVEQVDRGMIDVALISKPRVLGVNMRWEVISTERLVLVAPKKYENSDPFALLQDKPFIRFTRRAIVSGDIETWLHNKRIRVKSMIELESLEAVSNMVALDFGVSIIPYNEVYLDKRDDLIFVDLGSDIGFRELGLLSRLDSTKELAIDAITQCAKQASGSAYFVQGRR